MNADWSSYAHWRSHQASIAWEVGRVSGAAALALALAQLGNASQQPPGVAAFLSRALRATSSMGLTSVVGLPGADNTDEAGRAVGAWHAVGLLAVLFGDLADVAQGLASGDQGLELGRGLGDLVACATTGMGLDALTAWAGTAPGAAAETEMRLLCSCQRVIAFLDAVLARRTATGRARLQLSKSRVVSALTAAKLSARVAPWLALAEPSLGGGPGSAPSLYRCVTGLDRERLGDLADGAALAFGGAPRIKDKPHAAGQGEAEPLFFLDTGPASGRSEPPLDTGYAGADAEAADADAEADEEDQEQEAGAPLRENDLADELAEAQESLLHAQLPKVVDEAAGEAEAEELTADLGQLMQAGGRRTEAPEQSGKKSTKAPQTAPQSGETAAGTPLPRRRSTPAKAKARLRSATKRASLGVATDDGGVRATPKRVRKAR